jgi:hypothetical protein
MTISLSSATRTDQNWGSQYGAMFLLDRFGRNTWLLPPEEEMLMFAVDEANYELDVIEHDNGACPKMQFLEDPNGVGDEFVAGITCFICENRSEPQEYNWR